MDKTVDTKVILKTIDETGSLNSLEFSETHKIDHELVKGALNSLLLKNYVVLKKEVLDKWILAKDGLTALKEGTTEYKIWAKLADGPVSKDALSVSNLIYKE